MKKIYLLILILILFSCEDIKLEDIKDIKIKNDYKFNIGFDINESSARISSIPNGQTSITFIRDTDGGSTWNVQSFEPQNSINLVYGITPINESNWYDMDIQIWTNVPTKWTNKDYIYYSDFSWKRWTDCDESTGICRTFTDTESFPIFPSNHLYWQEQLKIEKNVYEYDANLTMFTGELTMRLDASNFNSFDVNDRPTIVKVTFSGINAYNTIDYEPFKLFFAPPLPWPTTTQTDYMLVDASSFESTKIVMPFDLRAEASVDIQFLRNETLLSTYLISLNKTTNTDLYEKINVQSAKKTILMLPEYSGKTTNGRISKSKIIVSYENI